MKHGISVDLEDWFSLVRRRIWGLDEAPSSRVVAATTVLLDLLDRTRTKATFFVLGRVAETFPELVREVARRGHEIGTHGHAHYRVDRSDPATFARDIRDSITAITSACGVRPKGHRAPEFSISKDTTWAYSVLVAEGMTYDSSVMPASARRYGIAGASPGPYTIDAAPGRSLRELPLATALVAGRRIPAAGGGYLRLLPYSVIDSAVRQAAAAARPAVLYVHPYEFDPQPLGFDRLPSLRARAFVAAQNAFRRRAGPRLERLLGSYEFGPLEALL